MVSHPFEARTDTLKQIEQLKTNQSLFIIFFILPFDLGHIIFLQKISFLRQSAGKTQLVHSFANFLLDSIDGVSQRLGHLFGNNNKKLLSFYNLVDFFIKNS